MRWRVHGIDGGACPDLWQLRRRYLYLRRGADLLYHLAGAAGGSAITCVAFEHLRAAGVMMALLGVLGTAGMICMHAWGTTAIRLHQRSVEEAVANAEAAVARSPRH